MSRPAAGAGHSQTAPLRPSLTVVEQAGRALDTRPPTPPPAGGTRALGGVGHPVGPPVDPTIAPGGRHYGGASPRAVPPCALAAALGGIAVLTTVTAVILALSWLAIQIIGSFE